MSDAQNTGASPPVDPGEIPLPPDPPAWPKAVGITSIVWGALGLTCGACGVAGGIASSYLSGMMPAEMGPMPDVMKPSPAQLVLGGVGILWAILLIVAGIMCVTRNPATRAMHLVYAVGSFVLTAAGTVLSVRQQFAIAEWVAQNPDSGWAKQQNPTVSWIILGATVVLGLAWPCFCLLWFGVVKRRPEDLTGGQVPAA